MEFHQKSANKKRVLFIYPGEENDSLGIEYLSASLKRAGHEVDLILDFKKERDFKKRLFNRISDFKPDFIGFSVVTDHYLWTRKTAKFVKQFFKIPIIVGGIHVNSSPDEVISEDFVDYIGIGECEEAIVELVENPSNKRIKNIWFKEKNGRIIKNPVRNLIENLDELPFPDRMLFQKEAPFLNEVYHCMTGRGCPFSCSYCFNNFMKRLYKNKGSWLRRRSVDNVIMELKIMKEKLNYKQIIFMDDCFTNDASWLEEFIKKYKEEINIPFKAMTHPVFINEKTASLLKKGGCIRLQLGVQTPVQRIRKDICQRNETNESIYKAIHEIKKQKIMVQIDHIFGLPTEKPEDYRESTLFYIDLKPSCISTFWLQYYPNTEIVDMGKKIGEVTQEDINKTIKGEFRYDDWINKRMSNPELRSIDNFFFWIPVLPRKISRFILKKHLYPILFKNKTMNKLPYFFQHLKSPTLIQTAMMSAKRKYLMKAHIKKL
jgi:anaerobic magnesium-protoporphyrin IX monomethyl ester cyclase